MTEHIQIYGLTLSQMATALNCAGESIVITDRKGLVHYVNPSFCRLSGYSPEEVLGQKPSLWRSDRHDKAFYANLWSTIEAGKVWQGELTNGKKDGSLYFAFLTIAPIFNDKLGIDGYVSTISDVTAYKNLQNELKNALEKSEQESKDKTRNLAHISHDIRTPLNGILGLLDILEEREHSSESKKFLGTMKRAGQNILSLINNILDYSKIDAKKLELDSVEFDILDCIEDIHQLSSPKAAAMNSVIKLRTPNQVPRIIGDPARVSRVLQNLVSNAVKFTENGEILIKLKVLDEDESKISLLLQIKDSGIGIAKDDQERIFEQYSQANAGISQKYGGTGLGLAISKRLVELMGGSISLESQLGHGTTFTLVIPFKKVGVSQLKEEDRMIEAAKPFQNLSALVCEDDEMSQKIMQRLLEKLGFHVELAGNGREGLQHLQNRNFDVALIDFQMPVLGGIELAALIRSSENKTMAQTPLIAVSGSAHFFKETSLEQTQFNDYIVKPYTIHSLSQALTRVLKT
ncbi:MAG: ATP-binding protein [Proteobacteria bacterium]|nr:ATP-binding protein [Pseudomonadota bacterium]